MAVTISLYNHTARRFADGSNISTDSFKLMLCTAAVYNAANVNLSDVAKTEVANGNGYTTGGAALTGVSVTTIGTNGAKFDANDVTWSATGGAITASYAILYNSTDVGEPLIAFIDFGEVETAGAGTDFLVVWNSSGIFTWTVA